MKKPSRDEKEAFVIKPKIVACAALLAALPGTPALAHHSFAMFDQTKTLVLKGTVTEFQWTNPHSFIELDAPATPGGKVEHWGIELNSPNNLTRQGWRRTSVKPGDVVTITINPLRNGMKGGLFNSVVLPDGHVLGGEHGVDGKPINVPTAN
jgi:hypothetical protein